MFFFERSVQWIVPYNTLIYVNWLPRYLTGFEINLDKSRKYPNMKLIMLHAICLLCKILIAMGYETMVVFHQISSISYGFRVKLNCSNTGTGRNPCITMRQSQAAQGPPWSWLHGSWNYNYLYNQRLSSLKVVFEFAHTWCTQYNVMWLITPYIIMLDSDWLIAVIFFYKFRPCIVNLQNFYFV